jgi:hypothetical protein
VALERRWLDATGNCRSLWRNSYAYSNSYTNADSNADAYSDSNTDAGPVEQRGSMGWGSAGSSWRVVSRS